ncbi:MAG: PilN domain-containing protein [Kiritimatiellales bacterium]|nr:PilN domain-containing protein [Kiritimatiellales bacterium]
MVKKANMCILFRDETVDVVFIDYSVLGAHIKFMERLPRDEQVFAAVAERMQGIAKMPSRVTLCVPRSSVMQRTLRYPSMVQADIASMIQFEATRHVPLPESDRTLAWSAVPSPDGKQVVLNLLAARQSELRTLANRFEECGVPIDEVVPFSSAVVALLGTAPTLLVVSDVRNVELCLYGAGQLQDSQLIRRDAPGFGPERVDTAARQMASKHKDWLGDEGIGRILLAGPEPLGGEFGAAFGLHVHPLEVPQGLVAAVADTPPLTDVLVAASAELPSTLNLVENTGRKVPISKRTIVVASLCALLAVELVASMAFKTGAPALQRRQVAEELAKVKRRAAPIQRMKDKNRDLRRQLYRLDEICRSHVSTMKLLRELSEALPSDTYLRSIGYKYGEGFRIRGFSKEPDKLPELIMAIPMVEAISTSEIEKEVDDYHEFTISVTLRNPDEKNDA